jgi:hypothetical protein
LLEPVLEPGGDPGTKAVRRDARIAVAEGVREGVRVERRRHAPRAAAVSGARHGNVGVSEQVPAEERVGGVPDRDPRALAIGGDARPGVQAVGAVGECVGIERPGRAEGRSRSGRRDAHHESYCRKPVAHDAAPLPLGPIAYSIRRPVATNEGVTLPRVASDYRWCGLARRRCDTERFGSRASNTVVARHWRARCSEPRVACSWRWRSSPQG